MEIARKVFERQQQRRFGASNPERMKLAFWEWMVRSSEDARLHDWSEAPAVHTPYALRKFFGQDGDYAKGPIWNFDRMGATRTPHPDGRMICIAGEHEDHYDPDFCIYNDVIVLDLTGCVDIYGYPKEVFPPTDFHSATLLDDRLIVIGRLGYHDERHPGTTPVFALDMANYRMEPLSSHGELPGWIFRHEAEAGPDGIVIRGGEVYEEIDRSPRLRRNFDDFLYDLGSGSWKRLTDRKWRQFSIRDEEGKPFMKGHRVRGCCGMEGESWKGESLGIPDFEAPFLYLEAVCPRNFEYEAVVSEESSLADRIVVAGIPVSIRIECFTIEVVIEGDMDYSMATAIAEDIRAGVEAETERPCLLERYEANRGLVR